MTGFFSKFLSSQFKYVRRGLISGAVLSSLVGFYSTSSYETFSASYCSILKNSVDFGIRHHGISKRLTPPVITDLFIESNSDISSKYGNYGEDAFFIVDSNRYAIFGVADGVGGWTKKGVDPSKFSNALVKHAALNSVALLKEGVDSILPNDIMSKAYNDLLMNDPTAYGSSTACFIVVDKQEGKVYVSNLGDSGCFIFKTNGASIRTKEQCHRYNCPFQLSLPPPEYKSTSRADLPSMAYNFSYDIEKGDYIIVGSDGVWDNIDLYSMKMSLVISDTNNITESALSFFSKCFYEEVLSNSKLEKKQSRKDNLNELSDPRCGYFGAKTDDITLLVASYIN